MVVNTPVSTQTDPLPANVLRVMCSAVMGGPVQVSLITSVILGQTQAVDTGMYLSVSSLCFTGPLVMCVPVSRSYWCSCPHFLSMSWKWLC